MVVTGTIEFDPRTLEQAELDVSAVPAPAASNRGVVEGSTAPESSNLDRALGDTRTRRLGSVPTPAAVADWRTDSIYVVTSRAR